MILFSFSTLIKKNIFSKLDFIIFSSFSYSANGFDIDYRDLGTLSSAVSEPSTTRHSKVDDITALNDTTVLCIQFDNIIPILE
jgi:hypothetical protein